MTSPDPRWAVTSWQDFLRLAAGGLKCNDDGEVLAYVAMTAADHEVTGSPLGNPYPVKRWAAEAGGRTWSLAFRSLVKREQGLPALDEDDPPPADDEEYIRLRVDQDRAAAEMAAVFLQVYDQTAMDDGIEPHGPPDPVDGAAVAAEAVLEIENHRAACRRAAELIAEDS
jgi:hypothetical protein